MFPTSKGKAFWCQRATVGQPDIIVCFPVYYQFMSVLLPQAVHDRQRKEAPFSPTQEMILFQLEQIGEKSLSTAEC